MTIVTYRIDEQEGRILFQITAFLLALILTLIFAEALLWIVFPVPLKQSVRVPLKQNLPGLKENIVYERNEFGLRSISMKTRSKPDNTIRIICIGASTTDQPTQNTEDTWSGILETKLQDTFADSGWKIEVAAYGRGGDGILTRLAWARENLPELNPDIAVILEGINDMCFLGGPRYSYTDLDKQLILYEKFRKMRDELSGEYLTTKDNDLFRMLQSYSQIMRRASRLHRLLLFQKTKREGKTIDWHSQNMDRLRNSYQQLPFIEKPSRTLNDPFHEFSDGIDALICFLYKSKIDAIILEQHALWKETMTEEEIKLLWFPINTQKGCVKVSMSWRINELNRYNEIQKKAAKKYGAVFFDLNKHILKNTDTFFDDCHFTDTGSEIVASLIYPIVRDKLQEHINKRDRNHSGR